MKSNDPNQTHPNPNARDDQPVNIEQKNRNVDFGKWLDQELQALVERHANFVTKKSIRTYFNR